MDSKKEREMRIRQLVSREYKLFKEEEIQASLPRTLYEKLCNNAERIVKIKPDKNTRKKLQEAIEFSHLNITPDGVMSFTTLFILATFIPMLLLILFGTMKIFIGIPFGYGVLILLLVIFFVIYVYSYPFQLKRRYEASVGSDVITMVLYIIMYMRNIPSLEGAVKFAAENISGDLGYELKKLLWDVEVGNYLSMEEALLDYSKKWAKNRPFIESVQLIITSLKQVGEKRMALLDEAINIILEGNREQARAFNQKLKLPVTLVHALGIILPAMGLVLFPIVAVFLKVEAAILFLGYDVILPFILYFVITTILEIRPATFSKIDITDNPELPPPGHFKLNNKNVPAWPVGFVIGASIVLFGVYLYFNEFVAFSQAGAEGIIPAVVITLGIAAGFASYFILVSAPRLAVREKTRQIESEFAEALFQLGNQISGGMPLERSMETSMERIKDLRIKELFSRALKNMRFLGFTFQQAFFDEKIGAIKYYPSKMIKSVMRTVVESSKKGVRTASVAMISISRYLKGLHETQEEVKESLNDTIGSLKFQAFFLTPMISGIIGTLAIIIIRVLRQLSLQSGSAGTSGLPLLTTFGEIAITPFQFIMIVSIYMIETSFILAMFVNSIENGEDPIGQQNITGYTLIIGSVVFFTSLFVTLMVFGPLISAAV